MFLHLHVYVKNIAFDTIGTFSKVHEDLKAETK